MDYQKQASRGILKEGDLDALETTRIVTTMRRGEGVSCSKEACTTSHRPTASLPATARLAWLGACHCLGA